MQFEDQTHLAIREAASTWRTVADLIRPLVARCTGTPVEMAQAVDTMTGAAMREHLAGRTARAAAAWHGWWDDLDASELEALGRDLGGHVDVETDFAGL